MLPEAWREALDPEGMAALAALEARLARESGEAEIFPPLATRYRALEVVAPDAVRVVILGQDPYHRPGQATGLAFAVPRGVRVPPSLRNVYRELKEDLGIDAPGHGDLSAWAAQGVLLLNTALSVRSGEPTSHAGYGWHEITGALLRFASRVSPPSAFLLWGGHAQSRAAHIDGTRHCVLAAGHPSFFSQHLFLGCRHFSQANAFLRDNGRPEVVWRLSPSE
jgi:uracil-DNA glycosylase